MSILALRTLSLLRLLRAFRVGWKLGLTRKQEGVKTKLVWT